ncbi:MAG: Rieske 2Fe-2S domain-containing protein [Chloroflexi bacterium]|nr:Rieske 2Fe-2S domain-containing protein [Chloroflexota bacterium]
MLTESKARLLVDPDTGVVSRKIFADPDIYEREQDCIFRHCWLFVGHESMLPSTGDFISNYMGEDPVIVWRGRSGLPQVFLNTCPHRGNKLCLFDRGNAPALTCSYHGWTFNTEGKLTGVPFERLAYDDALDHEANGLKTAKVATYSGLIFASWDPSVPSLDAYLGELRWWLDVFIGHQDFGGMQCIPSAQKYRMPGNWKLTADNFIGDFYHVPITHASFLRLFGRMSDEAYRGSPTGSFNFALEPAHGVGAVATDDRQLQRDLGIAQFLGPEAVEWVKERAARLKARVPGPAKPDGFVAGATFPNMTFQGSGAFEGELLALAHPRGPNYHEVWQWLLFERDAPTIVRQYAAAWTARRQSAAGLVGSDDGENFERIAENTRTPMTSELTFHYGMALRRDNEGLDAGGKTRDDWQIQGLPGTPSRAHFSEVNQRGFYRYWARQMGLEGTPA